MENIWVILTPKDEKLIEALKERVAEIETPVDALLWALRKVGASIAFLPFIEDEVNYDQNSLIIDNFPTAVPALKDILNHKNWSKLGIHPVLTKIDVPDPKSADLLYGKFCIVPFRGTSIKERE